MVGELCPPTCHPCSHLPAPSRLCISHALCPGRCPHPACGSSHLCIQTSAQESPLSDFHEQTKENNHMLPTSHHFFYFCFPGLCHQLVFFSRASPPVASAHPSLLSSSLINLCHLSVCLSLGGAPAVLFHCGVWVLTTRKELGNYPLNECVTCVQLSHNEAAGAGHSQRSPSPACVWSSSGRVLGGSVLPGGGTEAAGGLVRA